MKITDAMRDQLRTPKFPLWASIVPGRTTKGVVATHMAVGHAKNAVMAHVGRGQYNRLLGGLPVAEAEIYKLVEGHWELAWRIEEGTYPNDLPWKTPADEDKIAQQMIREAQEDLNQAEKKAKEARERLNSISGAQAT